MIAQHTGQQPRRRVLPLLTIGLAVLGLIVTSSVVWLGQREKEARRQEAEEIQQKRAEEAQRQEAARRQEVEEARRQEAEEARRQMVEEAQRQEAACQQDEACRQEAEKVRQEAEEAQRQMVEEAQRQEETLAEVDQQIKAWFEEQEARQQELEACLDEACRQEVIQRHEREREVLRQLLGERSLLQHQLEELRFQLGDSSSSRPDPLPAPPEPSPAPPEPSLSATHIFRMDAKLLKFIGGGVVTLPVLLCALYVIIAPTYGDADKKWAYGAVGTLLGFWLGAG